MYAKKAYRMPEKPVKPGEAWDPVKNGKPVEYIKVQTIITSPRSGQAVRSGRIAVRGKAFSGFGVITKVEISTNGGKDWQVAKLGPAKDYSWQEFDLEIEIKEGKQVEVLSRATDDKGNVQPLTQEWNPKGYLYNAVDRVILRGDSKVALLAEGEALASQHCLTCHSIGIASGQRLEIGEWKKTVRKMSDYGLVLNDDDTDKIAAYFAAKYPVGTPIDDDVRVELAANPSSILIGTQVDGDVRRGGKLFSRHCAVCHVGGKDKPRIAPLIKGRMLTEATYWSTVTNGKRTMPSFKDILSIQELADIRAWLR
jgi:mono/diheme cytochrome c family protein